MSFFSPDLHEAQQHAPYFEYNTFQGPLCLACFLHSIADDGQLDSRKTFVLREFVRAFGPDGPEGAEPLRQLLSQHASTLASGLLAAATSSQDLGLGAAVQEAAAAMCTCVPEYLPELFTERLLQLLLELPWPPCTTNSTNNSLDASQAHPSTSAHPSTQHAEAHAAAAVSCSLGLLQHLVSTYPAAARMCATALTRSEQLGQVLCAGLGCPLEAVVTPLLRTFSVLACGVNNSAAAGAVGCGVSSSSSATSTGCCLPPVVVQELFLQLLLLSPQLQRRPELQGLLLQVLLHLVATGYAVEQATLPLNTQRPSTAAAPVLSTHNSQQGSQLQQHYSQQQQQTQQLQQQQQVEQRSAALAAALMSGLKPGLLNTDHTMQLLGCQLLAAAVHRAPAVLLQQLIAADACEHMFDVLRGTLSSCSMGASILALQQQQQQGPGGAVVVTEDLQAAALSALQCLSTQGPSFSEHLHFGLDTLTDLLQHASTTCNSPLQYTTLSLLCDLMTQHHNNNSSSGGGGGLAGSSNGSSSSSGALLPAAALGRLAAAVAAVLPDVSAEEAAAAATAAAGGGSRTTGLHPTPELQQSYELACRLLSCLCVTYCLPSTATPNNSTNTTSINSSSVTFTTSSSKGAAAKAVSPHILTGSLKAQLLLSLLSSRAVVSGYLAAAAQLLTHALLLLGHSLSAACCINTAEQQQQGSSMLAAGPVGGGQQQQLLLLQRPHTSAVAAGGGGGGGSGLPASSNKQRHQQLHGKKGASSKGGSNCGSSKGGKGQPHTKTGSKQAAGSRADKLFTRKQQQAGFNSQLAASSSQGLAAAGDAEQQQGIADDVLCLFESVLLHLLPAAVRGWEALDLSEETASVAAGTAAAAVQEQQQAAAAMFQAVVSVLGAVLNVGASSPLVSPYLPPFCQQLLSNTKWTSVCLDLLSLLPLPPAVAVDAWQVLLMAAVQLQGDEFMTGSTTPINYVSLASTLASRVGSRLQLLELLCVGNSSAGSNTTSQQQHQTFGSSGGARGAAGGGSRRGSNGNSNSSGGSDIRRFCGVSELHKAALCIVAAALHAGDMCWQLQDVLTAADAAVGHAGPAIVSSQHELLLAVVRLYAQVEQQLLSDLEQQQLQLQQQQVLQLQDAAGAAGAYAPATQQQQYMQATGGAAAPLPAPPAPPAAILHAVGRLSPAQLSVLHPSDVAAGWMMGQQAGGGVLLLRGPVQLMLQQWMQQLLTPPPPAGTAGAAAGQGKGKPSQQQHSLVEAGGGQLWQQQQQELLQGVLAALQQQPSAIAAAMQLVHDGLNNPQQQQQQQQQQQVCPAAWLAVLTSLLLSCSISVRCSLSSQFVNQQQQHQQEEVPDASLSCAALQALLLGGAPAGGNTHHSFNHSTSTSVCLLQLTKRVIASTAAAAPSGASAAATDWASSGSSVGLMLACANCLAAVAAAVSAGGVTAAAAAGAGGAAATNKQELEHWLLQQGSQQVQQLASRLQQLLSVKSSHPWHPMQHSLLTSGAAAAAAWLHAAAISGADAELLQQLADSTDINTLMHRGVSAVLTPQPLQQQGREASVPQLSTHGGDSGADLMLQQLMAVLYSQHSLTCPPPPAATAAATAAAATIAAAAVPESSAGVSSASNGYRSDSFLAALVWQQHQQWLQLAGIISTSPVLFGSSSAGGAATGTATGTAAVAGLTPLQMLLLVQSQGPQSQLSLLLLDSLTLTFLQHGRRCWQQQQQPQPQVSDSPVLPWHVLLSVLQNTVAAASVPGACGWRHTAAAARCLSALYAGAAAAAAEACVGEDDDSNNGSSISSSVDAALVVLQSPWNAPVLTSALDRLCQKAVELRAVAAAAAAGSSNSSGSSGGGVSFRWLAEAEVQQHCQLWCADAQLLTSYIQLALKTAVTSPAAGGGRSSGIRRGSTGLQELQALLLPYLEQQQLLGVLCWGAGQCFSCCQALLIEDQHHQQQQVQGQNGGQEESQAGLLGHKAAACCLLMHFSGACFDLLDALLGSGCLDRQLAWLKQQLQHVLASCQQQQCYVGGGSNGVPAAVAVDVSSGLEGFAAQCVAAGGLQVLLDPTVQRLMMTDGCVLGRVGAGVGLQLLLQAYCGSGSSGGAGVGGGGVSVCQPLEVMPRLQRLLGQL